MNDRKKVTLAVAVKQLNGICEGLGDAVRDNVELKIWRKDRFYLSGWLAATFSWDNTPEGTQNWCDIYQLLCEMGI